LLAFRFCPWVEQTGTTAGWCENGKERVAMAAAVDGDGGALAELLRQQGLRGKWQLA